MAATEVLSNLNDFVLFPHQDKNISSTMYTNEYQNMSSYYPQYSEAHNESIYAAPMMSSAGYTESTYSTSGASGPSAASSAVGSPYSQPSHNVSAGQDQWVDIGLGIAGGLTSGEMFPTGPYPTDIGYVDPTLVSYDNSASIPITDSGYLGGYVQPPYQTRSVLPPSPSPSDLSGHDSHRTQAFRGVRGRTSPYLFHPYPTVGRKNSFTSHRSALSNGSPRSVSLGFEDSDKDSRRCPNPDCGRIVKDIKAHMLTHQAERPEKCPIVDCEYHIKGFARKYDRCRHTLTHFKGTMVCDFCPNSGSSQEKSFNRADVFKRHLTSVHSVEQSPPNSRKKSPSVRKTSDNEDNIAKCSTCSSTFRNPQELYDHLDDCVLKYLDKGEASEGINEHHLKTINNDKAVKETMERNLLPTEITNGPSAHRYEDDEDDDSWSSGESYSAKTTNHGGRKPGLTHSKGGIKLANKGRKNKKNHPASWGLPADKLQMKKRVLCVYDGERRLWKDEMMMENEFEVRIPFQDNRYVTDLDMLTVERADRFHDATEEQKGPWVPGSEVGKLMI